MSETVGILWNGAFSKYLQFSADVFWFVLRILLLSLEFLGWRQRQYLLHYLDSVADALIILPRVFWLMKSGKRMDHDANSGSRMKLIAEVDEQI